MKRMITAADTLIMTTAVLERENGASSEALAMVGGVGNSVGFI